MNTITSLQNPIIKNILKLYKKKERTTSNLFIIEGQREITRALENNLIIEYLYTSNNTESDLDEIKNWKQKISPTFVTEKVFEKISYRQHPDGYLGIFQQPKTDINQLNTIIKKNLSQTKNLLLLVLESPEKPGNLGAILRTADAVQTDAIIICNPKLDLFNPNVIRSSTGTFFSRPIFQTDSKTLIEILKKQQIQIICSTPDTKQLYYQVKYQQPTAIVMGTEHEGLSNLWLKNADQKIKIPMLGQADSLNLSVSTAIILYETIRQKLQ